MVLGLTVCVINVTFFISKPKIPMKFRYLKFFLRNFQLNVCFYFGMYGKKRLISIVRYQLDVWGSVFSGNPPLVIRVTEKKLGKTRVKGSRMARRGAEE